MADLFVVVAHSRGRSLIMPPGVVLAVAVVAEFVRVAGANTITRTWNNSGDVAFVASPDHAVVTNYTARLRVSGNPTVIDTLSLGVPTPDGNNVIVASLTTLFAGHAAGSYTVSILTTSPGGSTDSTESNAFTLPLA
jgi:hypothetical protein